MAKKTAAIQIEPLKIGYAQVRIDGTSPLICHHFGTGTKHNLRQQRQKGTNVKRQLQDPEAEFNAARYRITEDGRDVGEIPNFKTKKKLADGVPCRYIKGAMVEAAKFVGNLAMSDTKKMFYVKQDFVPVQVKNGKGYKTYGLDVEPEMQESIQRVGGKGPGTGAPDLRYRPLYTPWSCLFVVEYNANVAGLQQIAQLVDYAGFHVGLCEHRPSKGGENGRFRVVEINDVAV